MRNSRAKRKTANLLKGILPSKSSHPPPFRKYPHLFGARKRLRKKSARKTMQRRFSTVFNKSTDDAGICTINGKIRIAREKIANIPMTKSYVVIFLVCCAVVFCSVLGFAAIVVWSFRLVHKLLQFLDGNSPGL